MADAAFMIARARDAQVSIRAEGDKLLPQHLVSTELRELVRCHKDAIIAELRERWPNATAAARNFSVMAEPIRRDERAELAPKWPQAVLSRHPWWRRR